MDLSASLPMIWAWISTYELWLWSMSVVGLFVLAWCASKRSYFNEFGARSRRGAI